MIDCTKIEFDLINSDDLSVFSFSENFEEASIDVPFSLFSDIGFHSVDEEEQEPLPSLEATLAKLSRSMLLSARSRAMVSKNVYPDLRKRGLNKKVKKASALGPSSSMKTTVHKAQRTFCNKKNPYCNSGQCNTTKILGNSIVGGFLRATKKW
mmetsp:Transcript_36550/g.88582  ORF Transcript_36550/g.88582 Transcript_36550/m.88582 type:complete len:153 (-) Transcript_36550:111-569(-)